jgi:hypothetical protein
MRPTGLFSAFCAALVATALAGCGNALSLLPASFENREDTLRVWAATDTPLNLPSAYIMSSRSVVRLDQVGTFDFVYDVEPGGRHILQPLGAVVSTGSAGGLPGFQPTPTPFDDITVAQQLGYITKERVPFEVGDVFYVRSTLDGNCTLGIPYYAKLEIMAVDDSARSMKFRIVANVNCGYRGLELGFPKK